MREFLPKGFIKCLCQKFGINTKEVSFQQLQVITFVMIAEKHIQYVQYPHGKSILKSGTSSETCFPL